MTIEEINKFEKIHLQLKSFYREISEISKKAPNDAVNEFKLKYINHTLVDANTILKEQYKPFDDFDTFDLQSIPFNSDIVLILSQYLNSMENFKAHNTTSSMGDWFWISDSKTRIETTRPTTAPL